MSRFWISFGLLLIALQLVLCLEGSLLHEPKQASHLHKTDQIHGIDPSFTMNEMPEEHHLATAPDEPKTPTPEGVVKPPGARDNSPQYAWSHSHDHERAQQPGTQNMGGLQEKLKNLKDNVQEKIENVIPQTDHKNPTHPILGESKDKPIINQEVLQEKMQNLKENVQQGLENVQEKIQSVLPLENVQEKIQSVLPQKSATEKPAVDTTNLKEKMQNTKDYYTAAMKESVRTMKDQPLVDTEGLKEKATEIKENVQTGVENLKDTVQEKMANVQEGIQNLKNNVQAKMESVLPQKEKPLVDATNLKEKLENSRDLHKAEAKEQARYLKNQPLVDTEGLKEKATEVKDNLQEKATEIKDDLQGKATEIKYNIQQKASDMQETAQQKVDNALPESNTETEQPKTFVQNLKEKIDQVLHGK